MKKVVLLTGAAGSIGQETLRELVRRRDQYAIRALEIRNQRTEKVLQPFKGEVEICWGDLTDRASLDACAEGVDAVIHLGAIIPPLADRQPDLAERVNVQGTQNVIAAVQQHAPQAFFLYSSSISVYGDRVAEPLIRVTDPLKPSEGDYYAVTKIKAEQLLRNSGLTWSIFRLTGIFNAQQNFDPLLFHMPLATSLEIATTRDTGFAFVQALEHMPELQGRTFNLGGGAQCRIIYRDLVSESLARSGLGALDFPPEAFADQNFHCGYYADSEELERILHFQRDTLNDYWQWYDQNVSPARRQVTWLLRRPIKQQLLWQSEPYQALKQNDEKLIRRFFRQNKRAAASGE